MCFVFGISYFFGLSIIRELELVDSCISILYSNTLVASEADCLRWKLNRDRNLVFTLTVKRLRVSTREQF